MLLRAITLRTLPLLVFKPERTLEQRKKEIAAIEKDWAENPRWKGVKRGYTAADVVRLRGSVKI